MDPDTPTLLRIAVAGCGNRGRMYSRLIAEQREHFEIVAAADPVTDRVEFIRSLSKNPDFKSFSTADNLLLDEKLADILIIATQDKQHFNACARALQLGYDILLENPIADNLSDVIALQTLAEKFGRRVVVCHVLRYAPFYRKLKQIIDGGALGEIVSINANEGIGAWHMAHSFVRGHWSKVNNATPAIVAKCSHDMDVLHWLLGKKCVKLSSFGGLNYFTVKNKPAGAPQYCVNGCPIDATCIYNAKKYLTPQRDWLRLIHDKIDESSPAELQHGLAASMWGRCVYQCDNDAPDHQVVNMEFENGCTGTFTMTAFEYGRHYEIYGTNARLRAGLFYREKGGSDITIISNETSHVVSLSVDDSNLHNDSNPYSSAGDKGMIQELHTLFTSQQPPISALDSSIHGHVMAFCAEESRRTGKVVDVQEVESRYKRLP